MKADAQLSSGHDGVPIKLYLRGRFMGCHLLTEALCEGSQEGSGGPMSANIRTLSRS